MALGLAEDGWDVAVHYHGSAAEAEATAAEIRKLGRKAATIGADLAVEAEAAGVVARATAVLGPLRLLVNNASIFELDRLATAGRDSWSRHMEINLRAPIVLTQAFVAQLAGEGVVVNMLDQRVRNLTPNFLSYSVSKAGLWAATQVLAAEPSYRPGSTIPLAAARTMALLRQRPVSQGMALWGVVAVVLAAGALLYATGTGTRVPKAATATATTITAKTESASSPPENPFNVEIELPRTSFKVESTMGGWNAPAVAGWLEASMQEASETFFGEPSMYMGTGGSIPFMGLLGEKFPEAQFLVTGLLGPNSNAHGPNEFLHVATGKRLTSCVAKVLADHHAR